MLEALKFVQRGVARRDFVPGLTHFRIKDGRATGFNGAVSLSAPVDIGFNVAPNAGIFTKALDVCEDVITLKMEGENLLVRSGNFRTSVPCIPLDSVPETIPEGVTVHPQDSMLDSFKSLRSFVGIDASRPWAMGILLAGESAFATNNIIIAEYWLGYPFEHRVNIPSCVVDEVIRVNEELTHLQIADNSITFHYADGRWIKSQLLNLSWPNIVNALAMSWQGSNLRPVPEGLIAAGEKLLKFGDRKEGRRIYLRKGDVSTKREGAVNGGALVEFSGLVDFGCYNLDYLLEALKVSTHVDFTRYPSPVPFLGNKLRGAILGIREDV